MKFGPIAIYGRIDGIKHLDAKQRSFWQAVHTFTGRGVKPSVKVKRQYRSC